MKRKIIAVSLAVCMLALFSIPAFAGTSQNYINGVLVTTTCNLRDSSHMIYKSYGTGSANISYTQNGVVYSKVNVQGSSLSTYWVASKTLSSNQNAFAAETIYSTGSPVTAIP